MGGRPGPFWLRSVRARPAAFVVLAVLSAAAVAISILAPLLFRSVEQATLADSVTAAGRDKTAIIGIADVHAGLLDVPTRALAQIEDAVPAHGLWQQPIRATETAAQQHWTTQTPKAAEQSAGVSVATPGCRGVTLVAGRCVSATGQVLVERATAKAEHVTPGAVLSLKVDDERTDHLVVAGVYDGTRGTGEIIASPGGVDGRGLGSEPDLVVTSPEFENLALDGTAYSIRPLGRLVRLEDTGAIGSDIDSARNAALSVEGAQSNGRVNCGLPSVLLEIQPQHESAGVLLFVVGIEALGVAWFAEALVIQRIGRARAVEWGLGRLRGLRRGPWLGSIFLEPGIAVVAGSLAGFGIGIAVAAASATATLGASGSVQPGQPLVLIAAALALIGSLVALVAASVRSARLPLASLLRETTEPREASRLAVVAQAGVALVTLVVIASLFTSSTISGPQIALLAPVLVAVLAGVIGLRVAVVVVRRHARRPPRSLPGLVVGRQLARAPSALQVAVMVTVGVAIAVYVGQVGVVAVRLQDTRAQAQVGAETVLHVSVPENVDFVDAVRRADPTGHTAMAVDELTGASGSARIVAVDTPRLAAVSTWKAAWGGLDSASLLERLDPPTAKPLTVRGSRISVTLADVRSDPNLGMPSTVAFEMVVQNASGWHTVDFGIPRNGTLVSPPHVFPCQSTCRIVWLGSANISAEDQPYGFSATVASITTDEQTAATLKPSLRSERWRNRIGDQTSPGQAAQADVSDTAAGLRLGITDRDGGNVTSIAPRDAPEPLPALVGPSSTFVPFAGIPDTYLGTGLDDSSRLIRLVGRAHVLPRALGDGVLVDLTLMDRISDTSDSDAKHEVWLTAGAHTAVITALGREGIVVTGRESQTETAAAFEREPPTRAAVLGIAVGIASIVLALFAVAATRIVGASGRRRDWRSLRTAGVSGRRLRGIAALDTFVPIAVAAVVGSAAGIVAFAITVARLPLLAGAGATPPASYTPAVLPIVVVAVGTLVVAAAIAVVGARLEISTMDGEDAA